MNGLCERWIVAYSHDNSPVEGWMYVHKHKAEQQVNKTKNKNKFVVKKVCVVPEEIMQKILQSIPDNGIK